MSKLPGGKNTITSTKITYAERNRYAKHWLKPSDEKNVIDMWYDPVMSRYGLVNLKNQSVRLDTKYLKRLPVAEDDEGVGYAINFVADAFADLKEYMDMANKTSEGGNAFRASSKFFDIRVNSQNSWERLEDSYAEYMKMLFTPLTQQFLQQLDYKVSTITIDDFIKSLVRVSEQLGTTYVLTKTGWSEHILRRPNFNGLIVEIGANPNDHGNDLKKSDWIRDSGFRYWLRGAALHGFWVDRHAPWRLVANLGSLKMKKYMAKYRIYSLEQLFNRYYVPTHMDDVNNLKDFVYRFWKAFLRYEPDFEVATFSDTHQRTQIETIRREDITRHGFDNNYDDFYWMKLWWLLRCNEMGVKVGRREQNHLFRNMEKIKKELDVEAAMDYAVSILLEKSGQRYIPRKSFISRATDRQVIVKT